MTLLKNVLKDILLGTDEFKINTTKRITKKNQQSIKWNTSNNKGEHTLKGVFSVDTAGKRKRILEIVLTFRQRKVASSHVGHKLTTSTYFLTVMRSWLFSLSLWKSKLTLFKALSIQRRRNFKMWFHHENATVFSFHTTTEEFGNATIAGHLDLCLSKLSKSHDYCDAIDRLPCSKSFAFKMFSVNTKLKSWCF